MRKREIMAKEDNLSSIERKEVSKMLIKEKVKAHASELKNEFKKQISTAIIAAFGLIIALSWKDVITEYVSKLAFVKDYGLLITALAMTAVSVIGILLMSKWAKSGDKN
jgi:hypothetical protein